MNVTSKIYVAGHLGLVGSAISRALQKNGFTSIIHASFDDLDLRDPKAVMTFFSENQPEYVFLAAAKVGGILANDTYPVDFIRDNILIQMNVIEAAHKCGCKKLLFLGSSCIYPKFAEQPIREDSLLTAALEPTNEWYAIAKIAGIKTIQAYRRQHGFSGISIMPTNLYGPQDNFDLETSHVLPALMRKFHEAKKAGNIPVTVWGTGTQRREFLYVDDLAEAALFLMEKYDSENIINVGVGTDITIRELSQKIATIVGFKGDIIFDTSKPDGTPQKLLDVSRINNLGWKAKTSLADGLEKVYRWYCENESDILNRARK